MIAGIFHQGSGLGNQLFRYITTRVLALDKGYDFGMTEANDPSGKEMGFKGMSFMKLDMGKAVEDWKMDQYGYDRYKKFNEKKIVENGVDIRGYDPEINFVEDNTIIDGEFQDERYWGHRLPEIREWLKVEPLGIGEDVCVINFRGGEFSLYPDLFLTKEYWLEAMARIDREGMRYEVHTDDPIKAKEFFPNLPIIHDIGLNWRSIRHTKYLILSNSSFAILPALLNENVKEIIAPRYWGRRNIKVWSTPQNYYKKFTYI